MFLSRLCRFRLWDILRVFVYSVPSHDLIHSHNYCPYLECDFILRIYVFFPMHIILACRINPCDHVTHSRRMRNPQFYLSCKRPIESQFNSTLGVRYESSGYKQHQMIIVLIWKTATWYPIKCARSFVGFCSVVVILHLPPSFRVVSIASSYDCLSEREISPTWYEQCCARSNSPFTNMV